jgi:hypothetical protein
MTLSGIGAVAASFGGDSTIVKKKEGCRVDDGLSVTAAAADGCRCRCNRRKNEQLVGFKKMYVHGQRPWKQQVLLAVLLQVSLSLRRRCFNRESLLSLKKMK